MGAIAFETASQTSVPPVSLGDQPSPKILTSGRNALVLLVIVAGLWLACWPFADMAVNDDFTYAFTVKRLVETGHFTYNAWSTAMLGAQAVWAWPFVKAFGFSHDVLRVSMLPWSLTCAALTYALHRRFGINRSWSLFATLLLVASPLFTPWSASFMTDVPGLALLLAMLHAFVSLRWARSDREVLQFSLLLALFAVLGGSVRQSTVPLAAAAYAFELFKRWPTKRLFLIVLSVAIACGATSLAMLMWVSRQPYYLAELRPALSMLPNALRNLLLLALDGVLYALPLLFALLPAAVPSVRTRGVTLLIALCAIVGLAISVPHVTLSHAPWKGTTVMPTGLLEDVIDAPGHRPVVFGLIVRVALAVTVFWMLALVAVIVGRDLPQWTAGVRRWRAAPALREPSALVGLLLLALAYLCLLVPRAEYGLIFDRYLLVVFPVASLALLYGWRERLSAKPGWPAWAMLILFALGGAAVTFDHFAELRARATVAANLEATGVPRKHIVNSIGFDAWTQLIERGHLNDERIRKPIGGYVPDPDAAVREKIYWFLPETPAIDPRYIVMNVTNVPATLGDADTLHAYSAVLPPWKRYLVVRHQR